MTSIADGDDEDRAERLPSSPDSGSGPAVVALGGGHGLAASLRAARTYAGRVAGVVTVGDDGGSSGRLRTELGVAPPGDVRRCISALAAEDSLLTRALEYRFSDGTLNGHPIGNLLLTGLAMTCGDFQVAIDELCRLVAAEGRLFPATTVPVRLLADSDQGTLVGEVTIERAAGIRNLHHDPVDPPASPGAVSAVLEADQVVIGPGSLFTSVLATAVVPTIRDALTRTTARRVFVANVANDKAEARGFGLAEHLEALAGHGVPVDVVVAHRRDGQPGRGRELGSGIEIVWADLAALDGWGHDPDRLGEVLARLAGVASTRAGFGAWGR